MTWNPDYSLIFEKRQYVHNLAVENKDYQEGLKVYYKLNPAEFINDWCITYDPRNVSKGIPATMPFALFQRQTDLVEFLNGCLNDRTSGLVEKSRDMGATWVAVAFSVWLFLFHDGSSVGWGSRKEQLVDKIGDPDSIFEKIRMTLKYIPRFFLPKGFDINRNTSYMKIINPETGSTITGESGDNIGRGGRKLIYFKDESAWYEHPEMIEAALGDNTEVQIDISSVHGTGNIFHRRRQAGEIWNKGDTQTDKTRVFIMDWRDHPLKTQEWYDKRRKKSADEGLAHIFAQEVDRDYSAAVTGVVIPQLWIKAAIDAHIKLEIDDTGLSISALDVADGGIDKNSHVNRKGIILRHCDTWGDIVDDVGETTLRAISQAQELGASEIHYDCIGVGSGVKSESNRLIREELLGDEIKVIPWNASNTPLNPDDHIVEDDDKTPTNKDFYANMKAQGWWNLRRRFEKTFKAVTHGVKYSYDELISLSSELYNLHDIVDQLSQPTYKHDGVKRLLINKTPEGTRSPNDGDAIMMCYFPAQEHSLQVVII